LKYISYTKNLNEMNYTFHTKEKGTFNVQVNKNGTITKIEGKVPIKPIKVGMSIFRAVEILTLEYNKLLLKHTDLLNKYEVTERQSFIIKVNKPDWKYSSGNHPIIVSLLTLKGGRSVSACNHSFSNALDRALSELFSLSQKTLQNGRSNNTKSKTII